MAPILLTTEMCSDTYKRFCTAQYSSSTQKKWQMQVLHIFDASVTALFPETNAKVQLWSIARVAGRHLEKWEPTENWHWNLEKLIPEYAVYEA